MVPAALWPIALMLTIYHASSQSKLPQAGDIPYQDKFGHFFVFGLLAILVVRVFFESAHPWRGTIVAVLITSAYGVFDEFHQSLTPGRSVEFADWVVDTVGAMVASATYCFWPGWRNLLERRYRRRSTLRSMDARMTARVEDAKSS